MKRITLQSPAKLNLFLKVIKKRKDGYHAIETLFERINLCDDITLACNHTGRISIRCNDPQVPVSPRNLAWQAARLMQEKFSLKNGVDITIKKRIPVAAGLGGGSSNAATVIMGLSNLWKLSLQRQDMLDYARQIGSDVAFFLYRCNFALGTGRGEVITPLVIRKKLWHVVVVPETKVYSSQVYRALKLKLTKVNHDVNMLIHALRRDGVSSLKSLLANDLETAIVQRHPKLLNIKNHIICRCGLEQAHFSGSGPALFGIVNSARDAATGAAVLKRYYKRVFVTRTV